VHILLTAHCTDRVIIMLLLLASCTVTIIITIVITQATAVAGVEFYLRLSVYQSVFPHDISKTDAARITNIDIEIVPTKRIHFGVKRLRSCPKVKVTNHKSIASVGLCTLLSAGFSSYISCND